MNIMFHCNKCDHRYYVREGYLIKCPCCRAEGFSQIQYPPDSVENSMACNGNYQQDLHTIMQQHQMQKMGMGGVMTPPPHIDPEAVRKAELEKLITKHFTKEGKMNDNNLTSQEEIFVDAMRQRGITDPMQMALLLKIGFAEVKALETKVKKYLAGNNEDPEPDNK